MTAWRLVGFLVLGLLLALLDRLDLRTQLRRLPLMLFTHLGGLTVGIESPSASLGAAVPDSVRRSARLCWARPMPWRN
jgi:H+/Cl- antiporter ClcA